MKNQVEKIGVLGGGQLGRMLLQAASNFNLEIHILDQEKDGPAGQLIHHFTQGDVQNYDDVVQFGESVDIITIEIEHVNTDALKALEQKGKKVFPTASVVEIIKDKGLQKQFYAKHDIATAPFKLRQDKSDLLANLPNFPFVLKSRAGGYDGKGVQVVKNEQDLDQAFDVPMVVEQMADLKHEIAVIVAVNSAGDVEVFPPTEMVFDPVLNLVDYLFAPAGISAEAAKNAQDLAQKVVLAFNSPGLFAVELFQLKDDSFWVNEIAPRTHNSGHHTIEGNFTSQYEQQLRAILNWPLGDPSTRSEALMLNVIGSEGTGKAKWSGVQTLLETSGCYLHSYGKKQSKPGRKMGHITVLGKDRTSIIEKAKRVKQALQVNGAS